MGGSKKLVLAIAAVLFVAGLGLGLSTVTVGPNPDSPVSCGSLLSPDETAADREDFISELAFGDQDGAMSSACQDALERRQMPTYGLLALALIFLLGGLIVPSLQGQPARSANS